MFPCRDDDRPYSAIDELPRASDILRDLLAFPFRLLSQSLVGDQHDMVIITLLGRRLIDIESTQIRRILSSDIHAGLLFRPTLSHVRRQGAT